MNEQQQKSHLLEHGIIIFLVVFMLICTSALLKSQPTSEIQEGKILIPKTTLEVMQPTQVLSVHIATDGAMRIKSSR